MALVGRWVHDSGLQFGGLDSNGLRSLDLGFVHVPFSPWMGGWFRLRSGLAPTLIRTVTSDPA